MCASSEVAGPRDEDRERTDPAIVEVPAAEPAGVARRTLAYLLDLLVVGSVTFGVANQPGQPVEQRALTFGALATAAGSLYHVLLEGAFGRTVGKRVVRLAVVHENGGPCSLRQAVVRTALRPVDWLPLGYALGMASIRVTERRQRVGDLIAETLVVRTD